MAPGRSQGVLALVAAAAGILIACVFGFLTFTPGVDPAVAGFLQLSFFSGTVLAMGGSIAYFMLSRRARDAEGSRFDRLLDQRAAALGAVPVGLGAVLVGVLWYLSKSLGANSLNAPGLSNFASIDTAGIGAFLGLGSLYIIVATYVAIRAERAAIRLARDDVEAAP